MPRLQACATTADFTFPKADSVLIPALRCDTINSKGTGKGAGESVQTIGVSFMDPRIEEGARILKTVSNLYFCVTAPRTCVHAPP